VRYASNRLTKRNHFGHIGGVDLNLLFSLRKTIPAFTGTNEERQARLTKGVSLRCWRSSQTGDLSPMTVYLFRKPVFLFGDAIEEDEEILFDEN